MKTKEFLTLLNEHSDKSLLFEYQEGKTVGANYHITEIKNTTIDSVDCGAGTDYWKETVVQLWESPEEIGKREYMSVNKALSILNRVDRIKPMEPDAEIKFEYGNAAFHPAQLFVNEAVVTKGSLLVRLAVVKTVCKAREECSVPEATEAAEAVCSPERNCC
ncbi:MAG TPA: DUF6428 family protein [Eudoraea sp.]|nr:DUF6428 family protein [Eudoraea sp.]